MKNIFLILAMSLVTSSAFGFGYRCIDTVTGTGFLLREKPNTNSTKAEVLTKARNSVQYNMLYRNAYLSRTKSGGNIYGRDERYINWSAVRGCYVNRGIAHNFSIYDIGQGISATVSTPADIRTRPNSHCSPPRPMRPSPRNLNCIRVNGN